MRLTNRLHSCVKVSSGDDISKQIDIIKIWHKLALSAFHNSLPGFICVADYAEAVFPAGFARPRSWLAEAKSRHRRDEDWWRLQ